MRRPAPLLLLALAACGAPPTPPRAPAASARPVAAPRGAGIVATEPAPVSSDWRDVPLTAGGWTWAADARGSVALFGVAGQDAQLVLRCDAGARRISLSRPGGPPPGRAAALVVTTSFGVRVLPAAPITGATPAYIGAALAASDGLLDWMTFSRGRILIATEGLPRLVIPAWAEIGRVVEDCRG